MSKHTRYMLAKVQIFKFIHIHVSTNKVNVL